MTISRIDALSSGLDFPHSGDFDTDQLTDFEKRVLSFRSEWAYISDVILDRAEIAEDMNSIALRNTQAYKATRPAAKLLKAVALQDAGVPIRIIKDGEQEVKVIYNKGYIAGSGAPEQEKDMKAFSYDNPYFYLIGISFGAFSHETSEDEQKHLSFLLEKSDPDMTQEIIANSEWLLDSAQMTRQIIGRAAVDTWFYGRGSDSMSIQEGTPDEFEKMLGKGITPLNLEALSGLANTGAVINAKRIGIEQSSQASKSKLATYDYNPFD